MVANCKLEAVLAKVKLLEGKLAAATAVEDVPDKVGELHCHFAEWHTKIDRILDLLSSSRETCLAWVAMAAQQPLPVERPCQGPLPAESLLGADQQMQILLQEEQAQHVSDEIVCLRAGRPSSLSRPSQRCHRRAS